MRDSSGMRDSSSMRDSFSMRGSFTVEASLLMAVILPVLAALIYTGFYIHDSALLQGAACEIASMGSNLSQEADCGRLLKQKMEELKDRRLLGTRDSEGVLSLGENQVSVSYNGDFYVPGFISHLLNGNSLKIEKAWSRKLYHPADTIRKVRGLQKMVEMAEG